MKHHRASTETFFQKPRKEGATQGLPGPASKRCWPPMKSCSFIITGWERSFLSSGSNRQMNPVNGVKSCEIWRCSAPGYPSRLTSSCEELQRNHSLKHWTLNTVNTKESIKPKLGMGICSNPCTLLLRLPNEKVLVHSQIIILACSIILLILAISGVRILKHSILILKDDQQIISMYHL